MDICDYWKLSEIRGGEEVERWLVDCDQRSVCTSQSAMCALVGSGFDGVLVGCEVCSVRSWPVSVGVPPCSWTCRTVSCLGTDSQGRRSGGRWHVGLCVHLVTLSLCLINGFPVYWCSTPTYLVPYSCF